MANYCPPAVETIKGHKVQSYQGVQSTKKKTPQTKGMKKVIFKVAPEEYEMEDIPPPIKTKQLHIWDQSISKLYTDDCGRFSIRPRSGNKYIMIAYYCDLNTILQPPFDNSKNKHSIRAYKSITKRLADHGHQVDVKN